MYIVCVRYTKERVHAQWSPCGRLLPLNMRLIKSTRRGERRVGAAGAVAKGECVYRAFCARVLAIRRESKGCDMVAYLLKGRITHHPPSIALERINGQAQPRNSLIYMLVYIYILGKCVCVDINKKYNHTRSSSIHTMGLYLGL